MLRKTRTFVVIFLMISVLIFTSYRLTKAVTTDRTVPVIEMDRETVTVSVKGGDEAILEGVTATDAKDGDISENLFIESKTTFIEKGRIKATIAVADNDNHVVKAIREVIYSDYRSPQFTLSGPLKFQTARESQDDINITTGLGANDVIDGNISNRIKISGDYYINNSTPGDYYMEYSVSNSMGDTVRLPATVTIYSAAQESVLPQIILSTYLVNTSVGTEVDIKSLIEQISYRNSVYRLGGDGNYYSGEYYADGREIMIPSDYIQVVSEIDWNTPGVYEVTIKVTEPNTNLSNVARCYICVY